MSEFVAVLRSRVRDAEHALEVARQAGHPYEVHLHSARLADLLEIAQQHGVTVEERVDQPVAAED